MSPASDDRRVRIEPVNNPTPEVAELLGRGLQYGGRPYNVPATLGHHPRLLRAFLSFAELFLQRSTIPDRDRELLTLRAAYRADSEYYFGHHRRLGTALGLTAEEVSAVIDDGHTWPLEDRLLLTTVDELLDDGVVSDTTWLALLERYDTAQVLEILMLPGFYRMMQNLLASAGIEREPGVGGWSKSGEHPGSPDLRRDVIDEAGQV